MFAFFASLILRFGTSVIIRMVLKKKLRIQQKEAEQRAAVEAYRRRQEELRKAEEEQEIQERAEQERAREEQEREKAEKKERKRQAQQQERERHEQIMQEQEIQERAEQERAREEQEREKAEKKERKRQAQQQERERQEQRDRERDEELKRHFEEKLDEERRERKIGEKKWDTKIKYLNQVIQIGIEYCKQILPRGRSTCPSTGKHHCRCPKCQNQSSFQFLPNFALSGVDEEELHSIFNESFLPLQDKSDNSFAAAEFPEHPKYADSVALLELPDQLPCGFEADMLSMVMMAMNGVADNEVQCLDIAGFKDSNRAQVNTLFELLDQLPDDFEEDMESLDQIPSDFDEDIFDKSDHSFGAAEFSEHPKHGNNITLLELPEQLPCGSEDGMLTALNGATEAKEEGNGHFNAQNFEQAIKCYTKSIDQTPTAVAYANRAMAYLKVNNFTEAEKDCTKALDIDGKYFKAYARRAKARIELRRNLRGASGDVNAALELQPNCQEMKELRDELDQMLG